MSENRKVFEQGEGSFEFITGEEAEDEITEIEQSEDLDSMSIPELEALYWKKKIGLVERIERNIAKAEIESKKAIAEGIKEAKEEMGRNLDGIIVKAIKKHVGEDKT